MQSRLGTDDNGSIQIVQHVADPLGDEPLDIENPDGLLSGDLRSARKVTHGITVGGAIIRPGHDGGQRRRYDKGCRKQKP